MSSFNALIGRMLSIGAAMSCAACASLPPPSSPMPVGYAAPPPRGFVAYCEREPDECRVSQPELAQMEVAATRAASVTAVSSISYDWSAVFPKHEPAAAAEATGPYDWSAVFVKTALQTAPAKAQGATSDARTAKPDAAAPVPMNSATWGLLTRVNEHVNRAIAPQDDLRTYGVAEYWATPLEAGVAYGDCEDYVLEKRHSLIAAGVPASALSIAVVLTGRGETHAVLVVTTNAGDYVLDNRTPWILPWAQTGYRWRERQVAGSAAQWAFATAQAAAPAASKFLIAAVR